MAKSLPSNRADELDELLMGNVARDRQRHAPPPATSTLAQAAREGDAGGAIQWIDISQLDDNPFQPDGRLDPSGVRGMVKSFDIEGQMQAVEVRRNPSALGVGRFQIIFGHRRKAAVKAGANAGLKMAEPQLYIGKLLCVVRENVSDLEMLRRALRENNDRLPMSALQSGSMYRQMRDLTTHEMQQQGKLQPGKVASWRQIAQWNGYGESKYSDMQRMAALLDLPASILKYFEPEPRAKKKGKGQGQDDDEDDTDSEEPDSEEPNRIVLNSRHGRALLQFSKEPKQQNALLRAILKERLTGAQAEERVGAMRKAQPTPLDLQVEQEVKKQMREEKAEGASQAREDNRRALDEGRSHLKTVPAKATEEPPTSRETEPEATSTSAPGPINELQRGTGFDQNSAKASTDTSHAAIAALDAALDEVQWAAQTVEQSQPDHASRANIARQVDLLRVALDALEAASTPSST